ncbi:MAG: YlmC/YmxH family sporulation protein [Ruminococcus flavefaciens]|nr:YlmC/YmxH family sporulation protein [Ruminococcus flavefaciens]MCM1230472.1 YlmC/YmxH family sporulation protein [Ruminococcus flavefaciens]
MICSLDELKAKEVIDMKTGERLGYIDDIRMDTESSEVLSLLIYGGYRFFGLFGRESDTEIPCGSIKVIGSDIILVDGTGLTICTNIRRKKSGNLFE